MSTEYIHFTAEQKEAARQTDLVALLQSQGEHLKRSGKEYVWRDGSEKVTVRGNLWFHQYERIGGDAVDFVRRFYNMDFPQAVNFLLGNNGVSLPKAEPVKQEPKKPFELPLQNDNMRRVYAYLLNRRGIDREVLSAFVHKGMIYESADYHNAVFVEETVVKYLHPSDDYVSLTEIAKKYDAANPSYLIQSWLRSRNTVEFLATWERKHNSNFNEDAFQRITIDAKTPQFTLTPKKWIDLTNAIGIISKQGKSGGTMAHPFIACDFEMWNDAEFRFEVVRAFINSRTEIQNEIE